MGAVVGSPQDSQDQSGKLFLFMLQTSEERHKNAQKWQS